MASTTIMGDEVAVDRETLVTDGLRSVQQAHALISNINVLFPYPTSELRFTTHWENRALNFDSLITKDGHRRTLSCVTITLVRKQGTTYTTLACGYPTIQGDAPDVSLGIDQAEKEAYLQLLRRICTQMGQTMKTLSPDPHTINGMAALQPAQRSGEDPGGQRGPGRSGRRSSRGRGPGGAGDNGGQGAGRQSGPPGGPGDTLRDAVSERSKEDRDGRGDATPRRSSRLGGQRIAVEQPESNDMRDVKAEPVDDAMPEHDLANVDQSVNATKASSPEPSPLAEDQESALSELEWEQFSEGAMTLTYVGSSEDVGTSGKKGKAKVNSIIETPEDGGKRTSGRKRPRYRNADEVDTTSGTPSKLSGRLESSSKRRSRGKRKE